MMRTSRPADWTKLSEEELLQVRVRDLRLEIAGSAVEPLIQRLYDELDAAGIRFHPPCYFADEWLCPEKIPIIGIPFYLAHPRLKRIEKKMMFEVEGGTERSCMKLLRHECGHALNYAYNLYSKTRWRQLFGPFSARYSDSYYAQPYSRRFVIHLEGNYAQCHPDEDFAETFAVWLAPNNRWEIKHRGWPVIKKLRYIDGVMQKIGGQAPLNVNQGTPPWSASRMTSSLAAHYDRKRRVLGTEFKGFYDDSLKELFMVAHSDPSTTRASELLRQNRRQITTSVTKWTGHRKYDIYQLVNRLLARCEVLDLYARQNETDDIIGVTALVATIASNTFRVSTKHSP
ncbi:MAG TPA: putative zinc-binding metallopeptidase [Sedimentisphaerales bacterium]|nr:putative zinc-binding metallopeptidase [Sedimentisphaerales bacterium]